MREMLLDTKPVEGEQRKLRCRYLLTIGEKQVGRFACEAYGVKIVDELTGESITVPDLTVSASRIDELLELLIRNEVTPAGLEDVLADWL